MAEESGDLELADAIRAIRRELNLAMAEGKDEELRLRLGPIELELGVQVSSEKGLEGGVKVWVVSIGGRASRTNAETHRLKLTMYPQDRQGKDVDIHGQTGEKPVG